MLLNIDSGEISLGRPRMFMSCAQELDHLFPHSPASHRDAGPRKRDRNGKEHPLSFLSDAGPFCSDLSKRCREQILMWSLCQGKHSSFFRLFVVMTLLVLKVACTTYTAIFSAKSDLGTCIDTKRPRKLVSADIFGWDREECDCLSQAVVLNRHSYPVWNTKFWWMAP